jgi:hypothetical protein
VHRSETPRLDVQIPNLGIVPIPTVLAENTQRLFGILEVGIGHDPVLFRFAGEG